MAQIAVTFLLRKLGTFLVQEAQLLGGIGKEIEEIRDEMESIQAFLKDADRKRDSSEGIKTWVNQVRRVAYDIEDVIDEFALRFGMGHEGGGMTNFLSTLFSSVKQLPTSHGLANGVQAIKRRIDRTSQRRLMYDIQMIEEDRSLDATIRRWQDGEANFLDEADVVGFDEDVHCLVEQLVGVTGIDPETYKFISVVGMGGLGKTTLVRKVYKEPKVKAHFNCSAWISVSQSFNTKDLLKVMLVEFCETRNQNLMEEDIEKMDVDKLRTQLQNHLQDKRFILVLDDVWDRRVWDYIKFALPMNSNGSKIMITTRIKSVADALGTNESKNFIHELKIFPKDVAKVLLCRKAFQGSAMLLQFDVVCDSLPQEFDEVCDSVLQKCGGLPLAIAASGAALGGILYKKMTPEWKKVNDNLRCQLDNDSTSGSTSITSILKLSYNELPLCLKPCFLYCGLFPKDHLIKRNKLIRLWVAEGFIDGRSGVTKEEVGEEYLMQLIDRSMLQIADTADDGRVKTCRIHDRMHELAVSISQEVEFLFKLDTQVREEKVIKPRRLCVIGKDEEIVISNTIGIQLLRSLLFFDVGYIKSCDLISYLDKVMLLRVLDLEDAGLKELPKQIAQLLHLRYLGLKGNIGLKQLPKSIGSLQNLGTLDIKDTRVRKLPNEIVRLKNLRHLCMGHGWSISTKVPRGISNLRSLQTLVGVECSRKTIAAEIGQLKELRRLEIRSIKKKDAEELYAAIGDMRNLFRLLIIPLQEKKAIATPLFHRRRQHPPTTTPFVLP